MKLSDKDIEQLEILHAFLKNSFKGCTIGEVQIDDCAESLEKAIKSNRI